MSNADTIERHIRIPVRRATLDGILFQPNLTPSDGESRVRTGAGWVASAERGVSAAVGKVSAPADYIPTGRSRGMVIFSHGSGSSHQSPRNQAVARKLTANGFHALLSDLLTPGEDQNPKNRFDIELLSSRLQDIVQWVKSQQIYSDVPLGLFGASTGAASALLASIALGSTIQAVVSRGGRPDLAMESLHQVRCPTLLIVGELDFDCIRLNREALDELRCEKRLTIVPGASHLFEEGDALDHVAELSVRWFKNHLHPAAHLHVPEPQHAPHP